MGSSGSHLRVLVGLIMLLVCGLGLRSILLRHLRRWRRAGDRRLIEDALEHPLACPHEGHPASPESLAGALRLAPARLPPPLARIERLEQLRHLLVAEHHWTRPTAVCLMLFSLLHDPCSTTLWTIWRETKSGKWTLVGALMPLGLAFAATFLVATVARLLG